jgi:hypothetical protein
MLYDADGLMGNSAAEENHDRVKPQQAKTTTRKTSARVPSVLELSDDDDILQYKPQAKKQCTSKVRKASYKVTEIDGSESDESGFPGLMEIKFTIAIGDTSYTAKGQCGTDWSILEVNRAFAVACRLFEEDEVKEPGVQLPVFAYRTAESLAASSKTNADKQMFLNQGDWDDFVEQAREREEERYDLRKAGRKSLPKSLLPIRVELVQQKQVFDQFLTISLRS